MTLIAPLDVTCAVPARFPSPFATTPHALARHAAERLIAELRDGRHADARLDAPGNGKMFGVLVVADAEGRIGWLRAFSGMLGGRWNVDGYVPPVFDEHARDLVWGPGEAELARLAEQLRVLETPELAEKRTRLAALDGAHEHALAELLARHRDSRAARKLARTAGSDHHALDQASRADTAEKRRLLAGHAAARAVLADAVAIGDAQRGALEDERATRSRHYLRVLFDTYTLVSARGTSRSLREIFAPDEPPGGAGDCAAPKLLAHAYRTKLRPLAIAELWWGAPPLAGGRHAGQFYPACRGKCGPILTHMLDGLAADPTPAFGNAPIGDDEPRVVYEDHALVIVDKPVGLLSVPGRGDALRDSVQVRLAARYPGAQVVHRLDLDTSGLVLVAKGRETYTALQRLFARREIEKRYVAWLAGSPVRDHGIVDLALRGDLDDRPRQIHDPVHGKAAVTRWRIVQREHGRTKVELFPETGRTHQLRVHAAHSGGIGVPIVGDRLYGQESDRLLLHADRLAFVHPDTLSHISVERPASF